MLLPVLKRLVNFDERIRATVKQISTDVRR